MRLREFIESGAFHRAGDFELHVDRATGEYEYHSPMLELRVRARTHEDVERSFKQALEAHPKLRRAWREP